MPIYDAILEPRGDGGYIITFPDIPEAITEGDDIDEAIANASDALSVALDGYRFIGKPLPAHIPVLDGNRTVASIEVETQFHVKPLWNMSKGPPKMAGSVA